mmetsp:Transcript_21194/g.34990  ORF Transcript_21194/g.34990 Transcript_21194/m.34990 type:complete len:232 (+) Transcript_21194:97-792(+)
MFRGQVRYLSASHGNIVHGAHPPAAAKITDFRGASGGDEDVVALEVTMNDTSIVHVANCGRQFLGHGDDPCSAEDFGVGLDVLLQCAKGTKFHHDAGKWVGVPPLSLVAENTVETDNVGVVQGLQVAPLCLQQLPAASLIFRAHLDCHLLHCRVVHALGLENFCKATCPQRLRDLILLITTQHRACLQACAALRPLLRYRLLASTFTNVWGTRGDIGCHCMRRRPGAHRWG